jgi:hypothetical protein
MTPISEEETQGILQELETSRNTLETVCSALDSDKEVEEEEEITGEAKATILAHLQADILNQLLMHDKFKAFLASHYEITQKIDDENKAIGFTVRELTQEETMILMRKAMETAEQSESLIKVATESDLDKVKKPRFGKRRVR